MVKSILDHVQISYNKPLHKLNGNTAWNILELLPKYELRLLARLCKIPRSNMGHGNKSDIIKNITDYRNRITFNATLSPR